MTLDRRGAPRDNGRMHAVEHMAPGNPGEGTAPSSTSLLPTGPGVYRFRDTRGRVLYVGRATDLRSRVRSYWGPLGDRRHLARMVTRIGRIEAVICQSRHEAAWLERSMLEHWMPPWNRTAGGQEVPVWLKVTDSGVEVEQQPTRTGALFGPYLGATQARSAAAAINRIYPFHYANARSGAEREMARVRGVLPVDGARMRVAVVAALSGDPEAVAALRTERIDRRQASVVVMDYERAATIQRQLEGVEWIVEPSRVLDHGPDLEVHGWADGLLLTFELLGGRICDWRTRPSTQRNALGRLAATPVHWRDFATENAALGAALRAAR